LYVKIVKIGGLFNEDFVLIGHDANLAMRKKINLLSRPFLAAFCGSVVSQSFFWNFFQLFATACVSGSVWQFF